MKSCSLFIFRERQIITIMKDHLTLVRMAIIKKSANNKCWRGCGEKGTLLYSWWECNSVQSLWKTAWKFLRKLKIGREEPRWRRNRMGRPVSLLQIHRKNNWTLNKVHKQLLIASRGHQAPRKATHCLQREGKNFFFLFFLLFLLSFLFFFLFFSSISF